MKTCKTRQTWMRMRIRTVKRPRSIPMLALLQRHPRLEEVEPDADAGAGSEVLADDEKYLTMPWMQALLGGVVAGVVGALVLDGWAKAKGGPSHVTQVPLDKEGNMANVVNDEIELREDPEGEQKVTKDGQLQGDRQYRVRTFKIEGKGERLYMLSTGAGTVYWLSRQLSLFPKTQAALQDHHCGGGQERI